MKNKMIVAVALMLTATAAYSVQPMHDAPSFARALEILKEAKKQVQGVMELKRQAEETNSRIGDLKNQAKNLGQELKHWQTYYDKIDTLDANDFSILNGLGLNKDSLSRPQNTFSLIDNKLFKINPTASREEHSNAIHQMVHEREKIARSSLVTSLVLAEKNKSDVEGSKRKIVEVTAKSLNSQDLSSLIQAQTDMLAIVASELVMQRQLQAQILEFMSAHASNQYGTGRNDAPQKSNFKSSF